MNENVMKLQAVINTLELLNMPSTYDNANYMVGIYRTLKEVRDALQKMPVAEEPAEEDPEAEG